MSKVLYKIKVKDRLPETDKPVIVEFESGEVLRATVDENGYWWCVDMVSDLDEPDYWYCEAPPPELAEVLDKIQLKFDYFPMEKIGVRNPFGLSYRINYKEARILLESLKDILI